jgi:DNA-binding transcriptional regulator YbjK
MYGAVTVRKPADTRRREIADAALRIVAGEGLARFTAMAIAREVGVSDAALFRHFPTMDAITSPSSTGLRRSCSRGFRRRTRIPSLGSASSSGGASP